MRDDPLMPPSEELDQPLSKVDEAKLAWLRAAAQEAFASLDRGEGIVLDGEEAIHAFVADVLAEVRSNRK